MVLEDITPHSGPLQYVPGSHRWPWFEFAPDSVRVRKRGGKDPERRRQWAAKVKGLVAEDESETRLFTCERGEALIFHAGLAHGGLKVEDPHQTRRSFVTHYTTRRGRPGRLNVARTWFDATRRRWSD